MKEFNTTAVCIPSTHYMVDLYERVAEIKKLVDAGKYFTINRARQYGKTTTLSVLDLLLSKDYYVVSMDFQDYGDDTFQDPDSFCRDFSNDFCTILEERIDKKNEELCAAINALEKMANDTEKSVRLFTMFRGIKKSGMPQINQLC